jgi:O-succinylbenzoic acid--CoA ligase
MFLRTCPLSFDTQPASAATALQTLGLKPGDLIATRAEPNWQTLAFLLAAWRLSLNVALLPPNLPSYTLPPHRWIEDISPLFQAEPSSIKTLDLSKPALLLLTSGSSGSPKWASFSLSQLFESAETVANALQAKPKNSWLLSIPLHHVGGLGVALRCILTEGTLVFQEKELSLRERIVSANADFASLVPTQLYRLLQDPGPIPPTHFLIGGAPLCKELYQRARARGLHLSLTYALTEMSSTVLLTSNPIWDGPFPYLGEPLANRVLALSPDGELLVRGSSLFNGYGFPPSPPPALFSTGDKACYHPTFGWSIQGRKDFQFISGGENIQPEEIEAALLSHKDVEEAVVVPKRDPEFGERPAAFVRTTLTDEALCSYLTQYLPKYKIPILFERLNKQNGLKPNRKQLFESLNKNNLFSNT